MFKQIEKNNNPIDCLTEKNFFFLVKSANERYIISVPQAREAYPSARVIWSNSGELSCTNGDIRTIRPSINSIKPNKIFVSLLSIVIAFFFFFLGILWYII